MMSRTCALIGVSCMYEPGNVIWVHWNIHDKLSVLPVALQGVQLLLEDLYIRSALNFANTNPSEPSRTDTMSQLLLCVTSTLVWLGEGMASVGFGRQLSTRYMWTCVGLASLADMWDVSGIPYIQPDGLHITPCVGFDILPSSRAALWERRVDWLYLVASVPISSASLTTAESNCLLFISNSD